jgi:hypothetical protein
MLKNKKNKGIILIWVYVVIVALLILGSALLARSVSEHRIAVRNAQMTHAFYLAESGIDRALRAIKANFSTPQDDLDGDGSFDDYITIGAISQAFNLPTGLSGTQMVGQYKYRIDDSTTDVSITSSNVKRIRAMGYVPSVARPDITRWVEAFVTRTVPPGIPTNSAIWTSGELRLNGNSYGIDGNVSYETIYKDKPSHDGITGTETPLPAGTPMFHLNFDYLKEVAIAQGHYCTSSSCTYPTTFWHDVSTPNVTYIAYEGWRVTGNQTLGGIYVIAADVEAEIGSADIGGTVNVLGCVYALGNVKIHGTVDLSGGVWAGEGGAIIDGNVDLAYNATYVTAFKTLVESNPAVNITSWHEPGTVISPTTLQ